MKKQYFIFLAIAGMMIVSGAKAQNTPIDDFLKKYTSREGVTNVSMSQQMLQSIFAPSDASPAKVSASKSPSASSSSSSSDDKNGFKIERDDFVWTKSSPQNLNVPEAYSSVSISKADIPANLFPDFKKTLLSGKYEQFMEVNRENSNILGYYIKKVNDRNNEIMVLRQQKDQFSAIYLKGDIDINQVDRYLMRIRTALARMGAANHTGLMQPDMQLAFVMPELNDLQLSLPTLDKFNFSFDSDALKLNLEESMKGLECMMKNLENNEDFKRNIEESVKAGQKQVEDMQKRVEEAMDKVEEEQ